MKLIPLATPQQNSTPGQPESLSGPPPSPRTQSDAQRSSFVRSEDVAADSRTVTAEYRVEFSHSEPTGRTAADLLAQIRSGRAISRINSRA